MMRAMRRSINISKSLDVTRLAGKMNNAGL